MEPVTHVLTGACLARSGFNRKAAYATLTMAVSAEFPDVDTLWGLRGPVAGFQHHRGITHTFLGVPFEAAFLVGLVWLWHHWRVRRRKTDVSKPLTVAPVHWGWLYLAALVALLSHLLLDYTNNYGLRPFFPFNPHWYAASIVFIFDPVLFGILLFALVAPSIFRLVSSEIGARQQPFRGRGFAIAALLLVVFYWTFREVEHNHAVNLAMVQSFQQPGTPATPPNANASSSPEPSPVYLQPVRILANPDPLNPFRWYTVTDYGPVYQLGTADTRVGTFVPAGWSQPKPSQMAPAEQREIRAAEASPLGRVYVDWSSMPFVTVRPASSPTPQLATYVFFRDPRFMSDVSVLHRGKHTPLTGVVTLDADGHVVGQSMDGKREGPAAD